MINKYLFLLLVSISAFAFCPATAQTIRYVKPAGSGNGSSWAAASGNLQTIINASAATDQVWVAAGTYQPSAGANYNMKNGVAIYGGFAGGENSLSQRNWVTNVTILKGNSSTVIYNSSLSGTAVLDGFTITGGITNDQGGGMINVNSSPTISNCIFSGNISTGANGGGAGMLNQASSPVITNCTFTGNKSTYIGGAILNTFSSIPTITNCIFSGNQAGYGGASGNYSASATFTNCSFIGNTSDNFGGSMVNVVSSSSTLINCSFSGNKASYGVGVYNDQSNTVLKNCILWGNGTEVDNNNSSSYAYTNCLVKGLNPAGSGNLDGTLTTNDPLFVSQPAIGLGTSGNLRLQATSPVINKGNNTAVPTGIITDLDGNARIQLGMVDLGAYEASCQAFGDPTVFGSNTWNVYAWNAGGGSFTGNTSAWTTNYAGYYTDNNLDINTTARWDQNTSPSYANGYLGCPVQVDNMSYSAKRQGFPCSNYQIDIPGHDDGAQLWVNGVMVWSEDAYNPNTITNVWTGWLGANDKVELKVTEGTGGTFGKLHFVPITGGNGDPTVFGTNQWNVYAYNSGNGTFAGTDWATNYSGYYTSTALNINTGNDWPINTSPSNASNYKGCAIKYDSMSFSAKRQGFPCGYYQLDIPGHDDGAQLWVNGSMVWSQDGSNSGTITNVWTGWLGASDKVELKVTEGYGDAYGRLNFVPITNNVLYVDSSKAVGGNGTSWANAFKYLQDALVAATNHSACINQIWVAKGTYFPDDGGGKTNNDRSASFVMQNNLAIYGGFAGTEISLGQRNLKTNVVILSGDIDQNDATLGNANNSYRIIYNNGLNSTPLLDGAVIQAANNPNTSAGQSGGGIANYSSSPTFVNCIIRNNYSVVNGSGVYNSNSSPVFINCLFLGNIAGNIGGAMFTTVGSVVLTNCTFVGNRGTAYGEAIFGSQANTLLTINNCIVWGNSSGIYNDQNATAVINNSIVQNGCPGSSTCNNVLNTDPFFVDQPPVGLGTAGNLRLQTCSPAINAGVVVANIPTTDLDGNARVYGGFIDMGAYENQSAVTAVASPLPTANTSISQIVQGNTYIGNCSSLYGFLQPGTGANAVGGMVTAKVWVESTQPIYNGKPYVKRHYEITPATNPSVSTATVTLYFTQAEFDAFNNVPNITGKLPTGPTDAAGIANLRINKYSGTSSNGSGTPDSYSGTTVLIDPDDNNTVWNAAQNRWEITFPVTGFSGFFASNNVNAILPVTLGSFTGTCSGSIKTLSWNTLSETNNKAFIIEASNDGQNFTAIGTVAAKPGIANSYEFATASTAIFFRLKQMDVDGQFAYSAIVQLSCNATISKVTLYPNPAKDYAIISLPANQAYSKMELYDMLGKKIFQQYVIGSTSQQILVKNLANGEYYLRLYQSSGGMEILKLSVVH